MENKSSILRKIFHISFFIYPVTFAVALFCGMVFGIDSGWAMPAMSNHEIMYGWDAIVSYLIIIVWRFITVYVLVLIFQISYIVIGLFFKVKNKWKNSKTGYDNRDN